jgi:hydroxyacylglutathione hydrolase
MKVVPIPCLSDNYAYLLVCEATREAVIVDPSEPGPVIPAIDAADVKLRGIWNTHHHFDHTGGNEAVAAHYKLTWVSGHASDKGRIAGQTEFLEAGQRFKMGRLDVEILHIPGHTLGAIAYVVRGEGEGVALFTGDTMFHGGCGRLFEGSPAQMHASLRSLVAVGDEARVYPGHEYTVSNLKFAASLEPANASIGDALTRAKDKRDRGETTVGTNIALEKETNPFVRAVDGEALRVVRAAKDAWKG